MFDANMLPILAELRQRKWKWRTSKFKVHGTLAPNSSASAFSYQRNNRCLGDVWFQRWMSWNTWSRVDSRYGTSKDRSWGISKAENHVASQYTSVRYYPRVPWSCEQTSRVPMLDHLNKKHRTGKQHPKLWRNCSCRCQYMWNSGHPFFELDGQSKESTYKQGDGKNSGNPDNHSDLESTVSSRKWYHRNEMVGTRLCRTAAILHFAPLWLSLGLRYNASNLKTENGTA